MGSRASCFRPPLTGYSNIYLKTKKAGGMKITFQSPPKIIDERVIHNILKDYKMLNCEVLIRDENGMPTICDDWSCLKSIATVDDLIDVIMKDHRKYIRWYDVLDLHMRMALTFDSLYVYNKIDSISMEFLDKLAREPHTVVMSCELVGSCQIFVFERFVFFPRDFKQVFKGNRRICFTLGGNSISLSFSVSNCRIDLSKIASTQTLIRELGPWYPRCGKSVLGGVAADPGLHQTKRRGARLWRSTHCEKQIEH